MISGSINLSQRKKLHVASFYRPPRCTDKVYTDQANSEFRKLKAKAKGNPLIIGGDFNLPDIKWDNYTISGSRYPQSMTYKYLATIAECSFEQMVDFKTRRLTYPNSCISIRNT